jgi:hypothetical protein
MALPPGQSRQDSFNMEAISALISALPQASATLARNSMQKISAQLGRAATFLELSKSLGLYRSSIDADIKSNGINFEGNRKKYEKQGQNSGKNGNSTYAVNFQAKNGSQKPTQKQGNSVNYQSGHSGAHSSGPAPLVNGVSANYKGRNPIVGFVKGQGQNSGHSHGTAGASLPYCSLCGSIYHKASQGCPAMIGPNGTVVKCNPTQSTCPECPGMVQPRLHHPVGLCPFRPGGPFAR